MSVEFEIVDKSAIKVPIIIKVLEKLDGHYIPPISSLVDLTKYAERIVQNAEIIFAKSRNSIVGMSAVYCNDYDTYTAFITTIGIIKKYQGKGFGKKLLEQSIVLARAKGMNKIKLEVYENNSTAINFYKRNNFSIKNDKLRRLNNGGKERFLVMLKMI